jgi:hypothetical protein
VYALGAHGDLNEYTSDASGAIGPTYQDSVPFEDSARLAVNPNGKSLYVTLGTTAPGSTTSAPTARSPRRRAGLR